MLCAVFLYQPLGPAGSLSAVAIIWPLMIVWIGIGFRQSVLISGIALLAMFFLISGASAYEHLISSITMLIGVALATSGATGFESSAKGELQKSLAREMARSRRHESPLCVLHAEYASLVTPAEMVQLREALKERIHSYCELFTYETHIVGVIPELKEDARGTFKTRLLSELEKLNIHNVEIGVAAFPESAITLDELVEAAKVDRFEVPKVAQIARHQETTVGSIPNVKPQE